MPSLRFLLPALACVALPGLSAGCGDGAFTCLTNLVFSVDVAVVDANGVAVTDATLTFTVDGGPSQDCHAPTGAGTYACGDDQPGHFVITASRGGMTGSGEADVVSGECHVAPVALTIELE